MGGLVAAPINEAVFLLERLAPYELKQLRVELPELGVELNTGREGGDSPPTSFELDISRAKVMIIALDRAKSEAEAELTTGRQRIKKAQRLRLWSQIFALICSSGVLAALAFGQKGITIVASVLTLLSSIGTLVAEHWERLNGGKSNIYEAFEGAGKAAFRAGLLSSELGLRVEHCEKFNDGKLAELIGTANELCLELNTWVRATA